MQRSNYLALLKISRRLYVLLIWKLPRTFRNRTAGASSISFRIQPRDCALRLSQILHAVRQHPISPAITRLPTIAWFRNHQAMTDS